MQKLLIISGPTASGKTDLAIALAKKFHGELISADSRQVYIGMDIGTGKDFPNDKKSILAKHIVNQKARAYELPVYDFAGVPLWMYDVVHPNEAFSVSQYQFLARFAIENCVSRGMLPIVVGGTGLYIDSLTTSWSTFDIPPNEDLREALEQLSVAQLQQKLEELDPGQYNLLNNSDKYNPRRLVRRIELATSGASHRDQIPRLDTDILHIGLEICNEELTHRIEQRIHKRMKQGMLREVQSLLTSGYGWDLPSMSSLGFEQWKGHESTLDDSSLENRINTWKTKELQYAKRQRTWFNKNSNILKVDVESTNYVKKVEDIVSTWYTNREDHELKNRNIS